MVVREVSRLTTDCSCSGSHLSYPITSNGSPPSLNTHALHLNLPVILYRNIIPGDVSRKELVVIPAQSQETPHGGGPVLAYPEGEDRLGYHTLVHHLVEEGGYSTSS